MYTYNNKKIIESSNSSSFSVEENKLSYIKDEKVFVEENNVLVFEFYFEKLNSVRLINEMLFLFDEVNNLHLFNTINYLPINLGLGNDIKVLRHQNFYQKNWIVFKELSLFQNILGLKNSETKACFLREDFYPEVIFKEFVFGGSYLKKILKYHIKNGDLIWQTDISQIGKYVPFLEKDEKLREVDKFIGIYKEELIVLLTGGKFIGIATETGTINWEQSKVAINQTSNCFDYNFSEPYHPFLDEEKGIIYILQGEVFIEFDLNTKEAAYTWTSLELATENYVFIRQSRLVNNKILFSAYRNGNEGNDDTVGVFDIIKKEIVWKYTFNFEKDNFILNSQDNIQMNENSIFVLDRKSNLHIFEKEKVINLKASSE